MIKKRKRNSRASAQIRQMEESVGHMRVTLRDHSDFVAAMLEKIEQRLRDKDAPSAQ